MMEDIEDTERIELKSTTKKRLMRIRLDLKGLRETSLGCQIEIGS